MMTCCIRLSPSLLLLHANTHAHVSLPHALNPSAVCAFYTHVNSIITPKNMKRTQLWPLMHGLTHIHRLPSTLYALYAPIHSDTRTQMHTQTHQPLSIRGLEEWSQCAARQPADKGRAGVLQGHVCVCVCWGCKGLGNVGRFWEGPTAYTSEMHLSK